jgi:hypothetical protein
MPEFTERQTIELKVMDDIARGMREAVWRMEPFMSEAIAIHKQMEQITAPMVASMDILNAAVSPLLDEISRSQESFAKIAEWAMEKPISIEESFVAVTLPHRCASAKEVADIVLAGLEQGGQAKSPIEAVADLELKKSGSTGVLRFNPLSGTITQDGIPRHTFQKKYPSETGSRRLSKAGQVFNQLFIKKAVVHKKGGRIDNPGQPQRIDMLMGMATVSNKEEMRGIRNSIQKIIDKKHLALKISEGISDGAKVLLMTEEI